MRVARFSEGGQIRFGIVDGDDLVVLDGDPMFAGFQPTDERVPLADAQLLAPVIPRSKVVGVGRNFAAHAAELGNEVPTTPLIFLKPNTSVIGPGDAIRYPSQTSDLQHEGELAVVIGRVTRDVTAADALDHVFGVTIGNDVTARDLQKSDPQWTRGKGFDTFCPLGPWIETEFDASDLRIEVKVDGEVRQAGSTSQFIFGIGELIEFISSCMTLLPGDVILTGTPEGVGPMQVGQTVSVSIAGLGTLSNPIIAA